MIQCLMFTGAPLDEGLRTALYLTACGLIRNGNSYAKFTDENGQGGVSTKGKRRVVNSALHGIEFTATVDWKSQTITCNFLVKDTDIPPEEASYDGTLQWIPVTIETGEPGADWWK